jgi:hypothetical protein
MDTASTISDQDVVSKHYGVLSQRAHTLNYPIKKVGTVAEHFMKLVPRGYDMYKIAILMIVSILLFHMCATLIHTLQVDQVIE